MTRLPVLTMVLYTAMATPCFSAPKPMARVRIHAVDALGKGLGPVKVTGFHVQGAKTDYSSRFKEGEAESIPYGKYEISVRAGGIDVAETAAINHAEVFVVLSGSGIFIDYVSGAGPAVKGKIIGLPEDGEGPYWIRLFNLYHDVNCCRAKLIGHDGSFLAGSLEPGQYVLTVLHDGGVLYTGILRLEVRGDEIEIDIKTGTIKAHSAPPMPSFLPR